ncbi:hypothetical protein J4410_04855 [Candidatus Woesearchaeota archaeon]|nr:hypothetical protein [Candidatus Woesearchaeota archaeon]
MTEKLVTKAKQFSEEEFAHYYGKFGSAFMLEMTRQCVLMAEEKGGKLNMPALLTGIYFHEVGRTITDEPRTHEVSMNILKEMDITEKTKLHHLIRFKNIRNDANYRGFKVTTNQAQEILDFWNTCGQEIKSIIQKNIETPTKESDQQKKDNKK